MQRETGMATADLEGDSSSTASERDERFGAGGLLHGINLDCTEILKYLPLSASVSRGSFWPAADVFTSGMKIKDNAKVSSVFTSLNNAIKFLQYSQVLTTPHNFFSIHKF